MQMQAKLCKYTPRAANTNTELQIQSQIWKYSINLDLRTQFFSGTTLRPYQAIVQTAASWNCALALPLSLQLPLPLPLPLPLLKIHPYFDSPGAGLRRKKVSRDIKIRNIGNDSIDQNACHPRGIATKPLAADSCASGDGRRSYSDALLVSTEAPLLVSPEGVATLSAAGGAAMLLEACALDERRRRRSRSPAPSPLRFRFASASLSHPLPLPHCVRASISWG